MTLMFVFKKEFIFDRIASTVNSVFGEQPLVLGFNTSPVSVNGAMFVAGDLVAAHNQMKKDVVLQQFMDKQSSLVRKMITYSTPMTTDDWPYLYLERPNVPVLFGLLAVMLIGLAYMSIRKLHVYDTKERIAPLALLHFWALGAAFMLLEVNSISRAAVAFGNTWVVNTVIISGILSMIFIATLVAEFVPIRSNRFVGLGLLTSCVVLYFVNFSFFNQYTFIAKVVGVGLLAALPVFFSSLIFGRSFQSIPSKRWALSANLIGSLVGGLLASLSFLTGVRFLMLLVLLLYVIAIFSDRREAGCSSAPI